jgi:toxin-antitoxin system PIN domain toxin
VKIVDVNVLIYATDTETKHHDTAKPWLDAAMSGAETIGLPTAVTLAYVRLTTNPKVFRSPMSVQQSIGAAETWVQRSNVVVPAPTERHYRLVEELLNATGTGGNLVTDAHLGALAIEHGASVVSYDRDFARFPRVVWEHPG